MKNVWTSTTIIFRIAKSNSSIDYAVTSCCIDTRISRIVSHQAPHDRAKAPASTEQSWDIRQRNASNPKLHLLSLAQVNQRKCKLPQQTCGVPHPPPKLQQSDQWTASVYQHSEVHEAHTNTTVKKRRGTCQIQSEGPQTSRKRSPCLIAGNTHKDKAPAP